MWKTNILLTIGISLSLLANGQFGDEWINSTQEYYSFRVAADEFYRISRTELQEAGFPVSSIPASRIQLFREGREVALNVSTNADNTVDFIEFYGRRRDGSSDTQLYLSGTQPHTYYNLFSDSATYFITYLIGSGSGKRMGFSSDRNTTGLSLEAYHLEDTLAIFSDAYSTGRQVRTDVVMADYDRGEGWTGSFFRRNESRTFDFLLEGYNGEIAPVLETVLFGGNNLSHNVAINAGPNSSSLNLVGNIQFSGWNSQLFISNISDASVGSDDGMTINVFDEGFPNQSDRVSVGYVRVFYPSDFNIENGESATYSLDNISQRKAWLQVPTNEAANFRAFDVTDSFNAIRLTTTNFSDRLELVVSDVSVSNKILVTASPASVGRIRQVDIPSYDLENKDYLIITHPLLRTNDDVVMDYKTYRESEVGGAYSVQIANIDDLYNQFSFGDPTPLAISNFIRAANANNSVQHVFIIGKGFGPFFNDPVNGLSAPARLDSSFVHIPTYGDPGGDFMYVLGINANSRIPGLPVGRLNATNPSQVASYLNKVREMESLPFDDFSRKDFLQLSGGISQSEINSFSRIITDLGDIIETDFVGGKAFNTGKQSNENVEFIDISNRVNQGVGYITFFGHSSGNISDIEVGRPSDPSFGFNNKGKYPIFLVNGCNAGEIFDTNFTFGEDWIFEPDLGAINFIAHTSAALSSTLRDWSQLYYTIGYADDQFISRSVGDVMVETGKRYHAQNTSELTLTQIRQMQLQGDPAYRIFGADFPDYSIENSSLTAEAIDGGEILAVQDSFRLNIIVKNFGRTINDSLEVQVTRTFPDGSLQDYEASFERPLRQDTLVFFIPLRQDQLNTGSNILTVLLDPENEDEEMSETNNLASIEVNIFSGNTLNLFPVDNGLLDSDQVEFIWQSSSPLEEERSYDLEFDTSPNFSGSDRRSFTVNGEVLLRQPFDFSTLNLEDSTTIYWRTRFTNPAPDESDRWVENSFTIINNTNEGWGQFANGQIRTGEVSGILFNESLNQWEFQSSTTTIDFFTFGVDNSNLSISDIRTVIGGVNLILSTSLRGQCNDNTFNAIAIDDQSGEPYAPIVFSSLDAFTGAICGRLPQRIYQFRESNLIANIGPNPQNVLFATFIDEMDTRDYVIMFSIGQVDYSSWDQAVLDAMNSLGVSPSIISSLTDGQPVIILGRKEAPEGSATVITGNGSSDPITEQSITLQDNVDVSFISGSIKSTRIGPANSWESLSYNIAEEANDNINLTLSGISTDGQSNILFEQARTETLDIASIDAVQYPQLELSFSFQDEVDQTPPQLNFWQVNYQQPADGLLLPSDKEAVTFQEGEEISREIRLVNVSPSNFSDSLSIMATLINQTNGTIIEHSKKVAAPVSGDTTVFDVAFPSINMAGLNNLVVDVSANENEIYLLNNRFTLANLIEVEEDETNPIIDVTFDGFHILNGDVVSPNPNISIRMRDDNPLLFKADTSGFNISIRPPGETSEFQRINFSDPRLQFVPASENQDFQVELRPGPLEDGVYSMRVLAEDESGNRIREVDDPYEISFEVVNESTITHFYPYPNPFSTSCRFVFTLTGSEVPSRIKIQIMTVSGRVVREITQGEIGPIRIGNNITSYAWDGRDHYGDQLANGVYFYKVFIEGDGNNFAQRVTTADRAFKNGFGKLYILR